MTKYSILAFFLWSTFTFSQVKNEKEERISISEFPKVTQSYFNNFSKKVKLLKFYRETDGKKQSFEAKFKIKKLHYSIEFDTNGKLEDIEILIRQKHIPESIFSNIFNYFDTSFKNSRLLKIQKQYINHTETSDKEFIQQIVSYPNDRYTHFEIIAEIKTKETRELREFTFDKHGKFESSRKVISSSYEHALY